MKKKTYSQLLCVQKNQDNHGYHTIAMYLKKDLNESKFIDKHYATQVIITKYF